MNSSQTHERHCRGYIDRASLTSAVADLRVSVTWIGNRIDNMRIAVRRLVSGNLGLIQSCDSDTITAPVTRGSDGPVAGPPIITVHLVVPADRDR